MDIRVLRYFLAVAREESISGAAQYLHMTQPPLSRAISDLEEELGKQLFVRGSRKVTLTEDGLLLRKRATEIIDLVEKTENELSSASDADISGDLYIGSGETYSIRLIARIAKEIQQEHPGIRFHLYSGNADDVTDRLDKGLLDFGILIEPANIHKYDYIRLPSSDVWGVLMRKDAPLAAKDVVTPEDLFDLPLLISRQSMVSNGISGWFKHDVEQLNIVVTYNLIYNAARMVEEGVGYALTLDKLVNTTGDSELTFRPLSPTLEVGMDIVWKKYQFLTKAAELFLHRLEENL